MDIYEELYHMARLALAGRRQDIHMFIRKLARQLRQSQPDAAAKLNTLLAESPTRSSPLRSEEVASVPVDADSRLQLVRHEHPVVVESEPIWAETVCQRLNQVLSERQRERDLLREGLTPTKSLLFTGPPGVGKTLSARWLADKLNRPLLSLDLSAVMSSYLGRTGANVRHVLDYAKSLDCVFLLDELDAVAKRRDDNADIGELKRLVTVLLQQIDDWPPTGLLVAATNHPDLLDPAVWRRFDMVIDFPMPTDEQTRAAVSRLLTPKGVPDRLVEVASLAFKRLSFSDIEREILRVQRESVIHDEPLEARLRQLLHDLAKSRTASERKELAVALQQKAGLSQREASEWTGVHRHTIRAATNRTDNGEGGD
ncbi:MAG TPA: ATP-binding protein [Gemmataceae bacterium]|jgi:MoxR-like ATPase|nr:ATP-binding protein [Gemmataceae bacterium]